LDITNKWACAMVKAISTVGEENKWRKRKKERMREEDNNLKKTSLTNPRQKKQTQTRKH